jgi:antitoxin component YwqK of YwqJK toxin-antitoxin module
MDTKTLLLAIVFIVIVGSVMMVQEKRSHLRGEERFASGEIAKVFYKDQEGNFHGTYQEFSKEGDLEQEIEYDHGMVLSQKSYYPSGRLRSERKERGGYGLETINYLDE